MLINKVTETLYLWQLSSQFLSFFFFLEKIAASVKVPVWVACSVLQSKLTHGRCELTDYSEYYMQLIQATINDKISKHSIVLAWLPPTKATPIRHVDL